MQRNNKKRKSDGCSGFTLLEVMIAMSIIAIVLVSVFTLQAQTARMSFETQFQATAPLLAQRKMAEIETSLSEQSGEGSGNFGEEFPAYSWNSSVEEIESETLGSIAKDMKKIDVTISLNNEEQTVTFTTYRLANE
jgi:general secretion pathway protein I